MSLGVLPVVKKDGQWVEKHEEIFKIFKAINDTQSSAFVDYTKKSGIQCFSDNTIDFWMGMQRNTSNLVWYNIYDSSDNFSNLNLIVQSENQNCVYNYGGNPDPERCGKKFPCGICSVSNDKVLYLKGLCHDDLSFFDNEYYIYGLKNNRPYFR